jgi:hypothetical protein
MDFRTDCRSIPRWIRFLDAGAARAAASISSRGSIAAGAADAAGAKVAREHANSQGRGSQKA